MEKRRSRLTLSIWGIVVVAVLMLIGSEAAAIIGARRAALGQAQQSMHNLALSLAQHGEGTIEIADTVLRSVVHRLELQPPTAQDLQQIRSYLLEEAERSERIQGIFVYDAAGAWLASSVPVAPAGKNNADRQYFKHHLLANDRQTYIGPPVRSKSDGTWIMTITRRYNLPSGAFGGVVLVSIRLKYFSDFYLRFDVGARGSIGLIGTDGTLYARRPYVESDLGTSIQGSRIFQKIRSSLHGVAVYISPIDRIERISGYARLAGHPLTVVAAVSTHEALAEWRASSLHRVATALIGSILLTVLGAWLVRQVNRLRAAEARLALLARDDGLTGLANRRTLDQQIASELRRAARDKRDVSLILLDVDHFKSYNDTYGHQRGDQCLKRVAEVVGALAQRPGDLAARYGGEEFALLLPSIGREQVLAIAETLVGRIRALQIPHASSTTAPCVTVSAGTATYAADCPTPLPSELIDTSDTQLYRAKSTGRNRACQPPKRDGGN